MCSVGVIWEILEDCWEESLRITHSNDLSHSCRISVKEAEAPNFSIKEASLAHDSHNFIVEICILQHPKNLAWPEDIGIEDIALLDVA